MYYWLKLTKGSKHAHSQKYSGGGGHLLGTSGALLALLLGVMLFPTTPDAVHAEETGSTATLAIDPSIAISIPGEIAFAVTPTATGEFASGSATLSVSTNNSSGYALYLSAPDGNALKSLNPDTSATVAALSQPATSDSDDFANNTWGYNLGTSAPDASATYQAVPLDQSQPQQTTEAPTNDTYTLTFGAKVDNTMPSGTYTSTVTISVVANPVILTWDELVLMQDMNPSACAGAPVGATKRLKDDRDGKLYWVAKLADNQCWMTQNLDLDLSTDTALTPDDSDVSANWTPAMSTQTTLTSGDFSDNNGVRSFDGGMYVNSSLSSWTNCNYTSGTCSNWTKVEDETDGTKMVAMSEPRDDGVIIAGNTYDAHYLAGNYYQWNAAMAGTGESATTSGTNATDSICPKGWTLPTGGSSSRQYNQLVSAYSLSGSAGATALTKPPLYFIPAGYVYSGSLNAAGDVGVYWSSTATSSTFAYSLYFGSGSVSPSYSYSRYNGQSVRCLAR